MILRRGFSVRLGLGLLLPVLLLARVALADVPVLVPLVMDGRSLGMVNVYDEPGPRHVKTQDVWRLINGLIKPGYRMMATRAMESHEVWPMEEGRLGMSLSFNPAEVTVALRMPQELLQPEELKMGGHVSAPGGQVAPVADVAAYANLFAAETHQRNMGMASGRQPLAANVDAALNLKGWVLEGQGVYVEQRGGIGGFKTQNRRLVKDDPQRMLRMQAGELSYPTAGLQRYRELVGAGVARRFDLQPYRVTRPSGRAQFILDTPSTVDIYVNGNRLQTLQLAAGTYSLSDFPVVNGANDLKLVITDSAGRRSEETFPVMSDGDMLEPGLTSFAASAGVPAARTNDGDGAVFTGLYRQGVRDDMTIGANLQADAWQQVVGLEAAYTGSWGMVHGDVALGRDSRQDDAFDGALRLDYRNVIGQAANGLGLPWPLGGANDSWQASAEYRGAMFNLPEKGEPNRYSWVFSGSYTRSLTSRLSMTVGAQHRLGRLGEDDDTRLTSNLLWRLDEEWSLTLDMLLSGADGKGALVYLTWNPEATRTLSSAWDSRQKSQRLGWLQRPAGGQLGFDSDVALERRSTEEPGDTVHNYALAGTASYTGQRGVLRIRQDATTDGMDTQSQPANATTTQLSVAGALVYADGAWGVTRPVLNSFAIVDSKANVGVNPQMDVLLEDTDEDVDAGVVKSRFEASSARIGGAKMAAVLPDLSPYLYRPVNLEVMPDKGVVPTAQEQRLLLPAYKSGTRLALALTPRTMVYGTLLDADGGPLALQAGRVMALSDVHDDMMADIAEIEPAAGVAPGERGRMLFSNRDGAFSVHGLPPGKYSLMLASVEGWSHPFEVTELTGTELNLGTLQVSVLLHRERSMLTVDNGAEVRP